MFDWPFEAVTVGFQTQWKKPKKNQKQNATWLPCEASSNA
jgi:hypothetical protein